MNRKISIIMSVFNAEATLRESIDSILAQTYTDWEFIICNDCSNDSTQAILDEYKAAYPEKFILLKNDENKRLAYSLNRCLEVATGEYVARMDGDDLSVPERFEKQIAFLQENPQYDLVGSAMQRFNNEGYADIVYAPEKPDRNYMKKTVPFNHATIMTYRRVYEKLGGYTVAPRTMRAQDYDLWFRFYYENFNGYNMQEALYLVREDMNAIRRRTFKVRWYAFQTTRIGFNLLGFPKYLLVKAFFVTLIKSLTPYRAMAWYRAYQKKRELRRKEGS